MDRMSPGSQRKKKAHHVKSSVKSMIILFSIWTESFIRNLSCKSDCEWESSVLSRRFKTVTRGDAKKELAEIEQWQKVPSS
jgi:hypothetical protein